VFLILSASSDRPDLTKKYRGGPCAPFFFVVFYNLF
jgi:hypothetical protein